MFNETSLFPKHSHFIQMSGHDVNLTKTLETVTSVLNFESPQTQIIYLDGRQLGRATRIVDVNGLLLSVSVSLILIS